MDCPVCKNAMIAIELAEVETDHCTNCGGIWLDAGEMELLLGNQQQAKELLTSFKIDPDRTERQKKCPICLKKMQKIIVGQSATKMADKSAPPLLIDKCPRGDGLWFDKGELQNVLKNASLDEGKKIAKLLADMFGS